MSRFFYLNIYSFILAASGILALLIPFYLINKWIFILQALLALYLFSVSGKLFLSWKDKLSKIDILTKKNRNEFRPDTFEMFIQAPCGRQVVREALKNLGKQSEYRNLLKLQKPLREKIRDIWNPAKTAIYINDAK